MASTVLIRSALTQQEWVEIRKLALDRNVKVSSLTADCLRKHLLKKG